MVSRVEAVLAMKIALDRFHLAADQDSDILRLVCVLIPSQIKPLEPSIKVKQDIFNEKNAKYLFKLINKTQSKAFDRGRRKSVSVCLEVEFTKYDIWQEERITVESLCLYSYAKLKTLLGTKQQLNTYNRYHTFLQSFLD